MNQAPINLVPSPRLRSWRRIKDVFARHAIGLGGISVIGAVLLIFFYLAWEVTPLFLAPDLQGIDDAVAQVSESVAFVDVEEQEEVAFLLTRDGRATFHRIDDGSVIETSELPLEGQAITTVAGASPGSGLLAIGFGDGRVLIIQLRYESRYPEGQRVIVPSIEFPYGPAPLPERLGETALISLALADDDNRMTLAGVGQNGQVDLLQFGKVSNFLTGEISLEASRGQLPITGGQPQQVAIDAGQRWIFVSLEGGRLGFADIRSVAAPRLISQQRVTDRSITEIQMLLGGISLLLGDSGGQIFQLTPVRGADDEYQLQTIRQFSGMGAPIDRLIPEPRRKGFVALDQSGQVGVFHSTAGRRVMQHRIADSAIASAALSPRATGLMTLDEQGEVRFWHLENEHPEVSWDSLWGKVWYENYPQPEFIWQSSAANNDFEPKFSLVPLAFGTLKAALYAMLFAIPLAIGAAVYTAYFMAPAMRRVVKPTIEIMAALPTVILGFLAGLWFAPYLEDHLAGVFLTLLIVPLGTMVFAWLWSRLPETFTGRLPDGWQAGLLIPVSLLLGWLALALGGPVENTFFDGSLRQWISLELGWDYDQRNAMVVGVAMGFAVIPTIFSIAEDAVFSVPKSLTQGSLALGATPWQTVVRVVLPTASPGIFSALMIGFGRAVGETMIVLMATGNTPIMDMNLFEGMRTLSANIAVEMPESEVGSTHYRVLFLAAFVLFLFTFVFNTGAEIIRQRLRDKYANL